MSGEHTRVTFAFRDTFRPPERTQGTNWGAMFAFFACIAYWAGFIYLLVRLAIA